MKRKQTTHFLAGMLTMLLLVTLAVPALAASYTSKTITISPGITIYMDDTKLTPKDANGKEVEVFVYNGTTYLPVRAISEALDIPVEWEASTRSVYLGEHAGSVNYLLTVCPPYQTSGYDASSTYVMAGKKYANGFSVNSNGGYALFNLDGRYDTLTFELGHVDNEGGLDGEVQIYLDDELVFTADIYEEMLPKHYEVDLDGALQMKVKIEDDNKSWMFGSGVYSLVNVQVS